MQLAARRLLWAALAVLLVLGAYALALYVRDRPLMQQGMSGAAAEALMRPPVPYIAPALPVPACKYDRPNPLGEDARASSELDDTAAARIGAGRGLAPGRRWKGLAAVPTNSAFANMDPPSRSPRPLDNAWTAAPDAASGPWSQPNRNRDFEWDSIAARPTAPMWTPGEQRTYDGDPSTQECRLRGDGRGEYTSLEACQLWVGQRPSWPAL